LFLPHFNPSCASRRATVHGNWGDEPFALSALFTSSLKVSVCASGGLVWARLVFIKRQQWMTSRNSSTLALCQCVPSPSIGRITERSGETLKIGQTVKTANRTLRLITVPFMDDFASLNFEDLPSVVLPDNGRLRIAPKPIQMAGFGEARGREKL